MNCTLLRNANVYLSLRRMVFIGAACMLLSPGSGATVVEKFALDAYTGKVVIVDFWASWCVPCRRSFPWLNSMHDKYANRGLVIIGVNVDQELTAAEEFLAEFPARFGIFYDTSKDLAKEFGVVAMPSSFLIGRDGEIRTRHFGFKVKKQSEYEAAIVEALVDMEKSD